MNVDQINAMRVTALKGLQDDRLRVAAAVEAGSNAATLGELVQRVAAAEGALRAINRAARALEWAAKHNETVDWEAELVDQVLDGADDTWSGRGNDLKRAEFDGFRGQVRELLRGGWAAGRSAR